MGDLDIAAKVLVAEARHELVRIAIGAGRVGSVATEDTEVPATALRMDRVLRYTLPDEKKPRCLQTEVEARWDAGVPRRAFDRFSLLQRKLRRLSCLVVCLKPGQKQGRPRGFHVIHGPRGEEVARFEFPLLLAWELDADHVLARGSAALLPLLPYARGATPAHVERALRKLSRERSRERRGELQVVLATFAGDVFPGVSWIARIPLEVRMASTTYLSILNEGRATGHAEGTRDALALLVIGRLGTAGKKLVPRLANCDEDGLRRALELFVKDMPRAELLAELEAILPRTASPRSSTRKGRRQRGSK